SRLGDEEIGRTKPVLESQRPQRRPDIRVVQNQRKRAPAAFGTRFADELPQPRRGLRLVTPGRERTSAKRGLGPAVNLRRKSAAHRRSQQTLVLRPRDGRDGPDVL